jgi:uncharacterized caspase-like protein
MAESDRHALVVSSSRYADASLQPLTAPTEDADALAAVLRDPDVGSFRVREVIDQPSWVVAEEVERFFVERNLNDVALFYFSGHGIKDEDGALYFAAMNTKRQFLRSTAVPSDHMVAAMRRCRSRQQVLLLDCCYAGAFSRAMLTKSDDRVGVPERFATEGAGRVVITASDAMQYAFEGDQLRGEAPLSVFTRTLVEGIRTGEADQNHDGRVSLDELYDYVYERVRRSDPNQTPTTSSLEKRGEIVIALNPYARPPVSKPPRPRAEKPAAKPKPRRTSQRKEKASAGTVPPKVSQRDQPASPVPKRTRGAARREPQAARPKDAREQQRRILSELAHTEGIKLSELRKPLELLTQELEADEELLGVCRIIGIDVGVLAVTSRRLVLVQGGWFAPKVGEIPFKQIVAARAERGLRGRKLVITASPEGVTLIVFPEEPADALAALINERAQRDGP